MTTPSQNLSCDDPIIAEIRQVRAELAREANYDVHVIGERIREIERQHPERLVKIPPRGSIRK